MTQEEIKTDVVEEAKPIRKKRAPKAPKSMSEKPEESKVTIDVEKKIEEKRPEEDEPGEAPKKETVLEPGPVVEETILEPAKVEETVVLEPKKAVEEVVPAAPIEETRAAVLPTVPKASLVKANPQLPDSASRWLAVVNYGDNMRKVLIKASREKAERVVFNYNRKNKIS